MKTPERRLGPLAAQVEHYRLIFRWPERTASLLLPVLFLVSVGIHALAFYIFQVVYPPVVTSPPPPAHVTFLSPATPESEALLRWVNVQDPAEAARIGEVAPAALGEIAYTPSYATAQSFPREAEIPANPIAIPSGHTLLNPAAAKAAPVATAPGAVVSTLSFSAPLRARDTAPGAPLKIAATSAANRAANLRPTVFLVGIDGRGEVRYCFLQESSDDRTGSDNALDSEAEALLRQHPFTQSQTPLEWGFATFTWGAEAYAARSSGEPPPSLPVFREP